MSKITLTKNQINFLAKCCSKNTTKSVLQYVYFNTDGYAYSTDGHRLAAVAIPKLDKGYLVNPIMLSIVKNFYDLESICLPQINSNYPQAELLLPRQFKNFTKFTSSGADQFSKICDNLLAKKKLNLAFVIKNNQIIYTEGAGSRWLPPLVLEFFKKYDGITHSINTTGIFDTIVLNPSLLDVFRSHRWTELESNGFESPVVFGNGYGKDYFLIMPCGRRCEKLDFLINNSV
jgi:hypothetical protein